MKYLLYVLAGLGAVGVYFYLTRDKTPPGMISQAQKDAGNNAVIDSYSVLTPPIAMLTRPPLTNVNLRMVDPVLNIPPYGDTINQNGQTA